ncbi:MAG TPA: hypothetical protein VKV06_15765 [Acidimicrobiales bacterium]|nr:hypothetical protein [Acidimicrobiales bacterium]
MSGMAWTGVLAVEGVWADSRQLVILPGALLWAPRAELPVRLAGETVGTVSRHSVRRAGGLICATGVMQGDPLVLPQGLAAIIDTADTEDEGLKVTSGRLVGVRLTDKPEWPICRLVYRDALE